MASNNISPASGQAEGFAGIGAARANGQTIKTGATTAPAEAFVPNERDAKGHPKGMDSFSGKNHS